MSKIIQDDYNNKITIKEYNDDFIVIPMPICYYDVNDDDGVRHYDFDEMANELASRVLASLGRKVTIIIKEGEWWVIIVMTIQEIY